MVQQGDARLVDSRSGIGIVDDASTKIPAKAREAAIAGRLVDQSANGKLLPAIQVQKRLARGAMVSRPEQSAIRDACSPGDGPSGRSRIAFGKASRN